MKKSTEVIMASLVTIPVTFFAVRGFTAAPSTRPSLEGCGTHRGVVVAGGTDVSVGRQRQVLIDEWNEKHPGPDEHATLVEVGASSDQQRSELTAAEESRSCAYDVLILDAPWTAEFAQRGFVRPVRESWLENPGDFVHSVMETGKWRSRQYAVPWNTDVGLLYARAGTPMPSSWEQLLNEGYAAELADYEGLTVNALEVLWNTPGAENVLSGPVDKVDVGVVRNTILPGLRKLAANRAEAASRSFTEAEAIDAFINGDQQLVRHWPYAFRTLTADARTHGAFEVGGLPGPGISVLGGQNLAVSSYSRHEAEAGALIRFLTGTHAETTLFSCGGFAPTRSTAFIARSCGEPEFTKDPDVPTPAQLGMFAGTLKAALYNARPRPITPYYVQFSETFRTCVEKVLGGAEPSAQTVTNALNAALAGRHQGC
jgi:multiple sugar transport system substrate-binding protein